MGSFGGFWATPSLLLLAESSVGTLELLRDSRNEARKYVSNHSLTAVLHAGVLGPPEGRCPRRVERCGWRTLPCNECSVASMVKVGKVCPRTLLLCLSCHLKGPRTHVCQPVLVGGLQKPPALETPGSCAWGGHFPTWPIRLTGSQWVWVLFKIQVEGEWGRTEAQAAGSCLPACLCVFSDTLFGFFLHHQNLGAAPHGPSFLSAGLEPV